MPRDKLQRYREMRSAEATNEPFGFDDTRRESSLTGAFVVHLHDATRRHYDVRLEAGGELLSFAVPHGPSLDPAKKHLAVKTEDHPIEYLEFEDVIPHGEYGGGPMIAWDRGAVTYLEGPPEEEIATGKLHVELRGMKLRGRWAFVKLAKSVKGNEWLFFKKEDEGSSTTRDLIEELPRSVLSGLTVEELASKDAIGARLLERAKAKGAKKLAASLAASRSSPLATAEGAVSRSHVPAPPSTRKPRGTSVAPRPNLYDADLGGVRVLAVRDGDVVILRRWTTDKAEDLENFYPEIVRALRSLPSSRLALDAELVAFDVSGRPNRGALARRAASFGTEGALRAITDTPVTLVATDLLSLGDLDVRMLAIEDRRALLEAALPALGFLRAATPLDGQEEQIVEACAALGIGAAIAKPHGSMYGEGTWRRLDTGVAPPSQAHIAHAHGVRKVSVTNRDKVFWPASEGGAIPAITKGDLVDYYAAVSDVLVPFLKHRPLILVRYPDGIAGKNFYQWNVPAGMPAWVRTITVRDVDENPEKPRAKRTFLVEDAATLQYIANLGCIPLHVLASRAPNLDVSDFFTIDFDVKQSSLAHAVTLARTLHRILEEIGLSSYPKTSGQSGLHVLVPLGRGQTFDTARALADLLGRLLVDAHPDIATMDRVVNRRGEKVYVDTGQTGTSRAIVAPYSVRAVPGATVSTPLAWSEVTPKLDPRQFTIQTVPERIAKKGDLLAGILEATPDIPAAVAKLAQRLTP